HCPAIALLVSGGFRSRVFETDKRLFRFEYQPVSLVSSCSAIQHLDQFPASRSIFSEHFLNLGVQIDTTWKFNRMDLI
ncbi:MAG TPA: hypothetical protein VJP02_08080, partial [Candidatus Sulfotelmatobacter sp.]|nr:hypothetical protein [Candidatus Sulfotelmatobacter sp.]